MRFLVWLALSELWLRRERTFLSLLALALSAGLVVATGISSVISQLLIIRECLTQFQGNEYVIALIFFAMRYGPSIRFFRLPGNPAQPAYHDQRN